MAECCVRQRSLREGLASDEKPSLTTGTVMIKPLTLQSWEAGLGENVNHRNKRVHERKNVINNMINYGRQILPRL